MRWLPPFIWRRRESIMLSCMVFRRRESQTVLSGAVFVMRPARRARAANATRVARVTRSAPARAGRRVVYIYYSFPHHWEWLTRNLKRSSREPQVMT